MTKKLWGGRFSKTTNPLVEEFTKSFDYDQKLAEYDIFGSQTHVVVLQKCGYLTAEESEKLYSSLNEIDESIKNGTVKWDKNSEDIHTAIQNILEEKVGDLVLKLQTARSRNDQVVFATKLYCKFEIGEVASAIVQLIEEIKELIKKYEELIIPGFTHLQHAQPVYLKDYLGAYNQMFDRDVKRLNYIKERLRITMGAGALAGTPINAEDYRVKLNEILLPKFKEMFNVEVTTNSIDSVSDRDFVIEIISALSIIAMHISRLSEDLIIWSTTEFGFIEIDEGFSTGSSLMPQKKNPDVLELMRGYAGRLMGNLVSVLSMMKGLPLTYNRDMQLDKEPLFNSFEIVKIELKTLIGLIQTLKFNKEKIENQLKDEALYATDIAYYLVIEKKIPFKEAHDIAGELIKYVINNKTSIKDMSEDLLKKEFSDKIVKKEIVRLLDPKISVESKKSIKRD